MKRILCVSLVVASAVLAQTLSPTAPNQVPVNTWSATYGAIFDGGLSVGAAGTLGADTLSADECQARFVANGYNNAKSPIVLILDDPRNRVAGLGVEVVALDAGFQEASFNQTPLVQARFWRPVADGTASTAWFYQGSFTITGSGGPTSRSLWVQSNTGTLGFFPGFWCLVPLATGAGVDKVFQRINVARIPVTQPR